MRLHTASVTTTTLVVLLSLAVWLPSPVDAEFVFMLPSDYGFAQEHFGIPIETLLRDAIKVYNYSDLIVTVPDNWEYSAMIKAYIREQEETHTNSKKRSNEDELWQQVHLNYNRRQRWLHSGDFTDEVMAYINDLEGSTTNSWGLDRIDQQKLTTQTPLDGNYLGFEAGVSDQRVVHFYVIDTGVATHPAIPQTISYDFSYYPDDPADCNGHGTHVAGIAMSIGMGVSPGTNHIIHSIKVLDCFGLGDTTGVLAGLSWVKAHYQSPAVINMSIGIKGISSTLSNMVKSMRSLGIVFVGATGNQGDNACLYFPAGITSPGDIPVVGVSALAQPIGLSDTSASFSNWGSCTKVYAPGASIKSTLPGGLTGKKSGTSMAAPFVAGAIILALATTPSLTATQARDLVLSRVTVGTVSGSNVAAGTNNVLWVPPALDQPTVPPALATSTAGVTTSTARASTTNGIIASTTSTARGTTLSATTSASRTTSTRASTAAATAVGTTTRAASTSTTRASTTGRSSTTRASTTGRASTTSTTRASTSAATSTRAATSRSTSTAATSTKATSTRALSTTSSTARASTSATSSTRATSTRATTSFATSTKATSTRAATTTASTTRASTTGLTSTRSASTRSTSTASTSARATTSRSASTTASTRAASTRSTSTASTSARATTTRSSTSTTSAARSTTRASTSTRASSTRATTTGSASTRGTTTRALSASTSTTRGATTAVTSTRAATTRGTTTAATSTRATSTASTRAASTTSTRASTTARTSTTRATTTGRASTTLAATGAG